MGSSATFSLLAGGTLITLGLLAGNAAIGQTPATTTAQKAGDVGGLEEVLVSARKRDESIVDVPLAVTVVSAAQMQKLDIRGTTDLAKFVPGLEFNDFTGGNSRNDRGQNRPLIFRGLNLGAGGSIVAAGGMFLDGAAVVGNEVPGGLDIGSVEILRGPQSVYFGRSAMTGAVSYRTKDIPNKWGATVNLKAAQRSDRNFEVSVAGPIVEGLLGLRLTGLKESTDGYVANSFDGGTLGDRSRKSLSATLHFTPTDSIDVKLYGNKFSDDDGASATVFLTTPISLTGSSACQQPRGTGAQLVPGVALPAVIRSTICGEIPTPAKAGPGISVNYHNTSIPTQFANTIFSTPLLAGQGFNSQVGLQRKVVNSHLTANFKISDSLTLQWISGYHTNVSTNAADGIGEPVPSSFLYNQYFYTLTGRTKDTSHEIRLSSDATKKFSWTVGTNYVDAFNRSNAIVAFLYQRSPGIARISPLPLGTALSPFVYDPVPQTVGTFFAKTNGIFAGGYLKMANDKLTLSAEGRYQTDKRTDQVQTVAGITTAGPFEKKFNSFSPRVSLDYDVGGDRKIYASYAKGNRPGGFNGGLAARLDPASPIYNAAAAAEIRALIGITDISYKEEKLQMFEAGFKGYLDEGKGYFDVNVYSGKVLDQQVNNATLIPSLGFTVAAINNIGETKIHGLEFQGSYNFTRELSLSGTMAWNYAERSKFTNTGGAVQFGRHVLDGVKMALAPEYTASAVLSYDRPLAGSWGFFTNGSLVYRGKLFTDVANLSWIKPRMQFDYRVGVTRDKYRLEAFVANVFDNRDYTGGNVASDFGGSGDANSPPFFSARGYSFFGAIAPPRQLGIRLNLNF